MWYGKERYFHHRESGAGQNIERTRGYCFQLQHIRGVRNKFADALSRQPLMNNSCAEDFPGFGATCMAKKIYGVEGTAVPEHREDILQMAEKGLDC